MKLLNIGVFERLTKQRLTTINEVANAIYGINPNTKQTDIPEEGREEMAGVKKNMARAIKAIHSGSYGIGMSSEIDSDMVFAAGFDYMKEGVTPEEIIERGKEAIIYFSRANN